MLKINLLTFILAIYWPNPPKCSNDILTPIHYHEITDPPWGCEVSGKAVRLHTFEIASRGFQEKLRSPSPEPPERRLGFTLLKFPLEDFARILEAQPQRGSGGGLRGFSANPRSRNQTGPGYPCKPNVLGEGRVDPVNYKEKHPAEEP